VQQREAEQDDNRNHEIADHRPPYEVALASPLHVSPETLFVLEGFRHPVEVIAGPSDSPLRKGELA